MLAMPLYIHLTISIGFYLIGLSISIWMWYLFPKKPILKVQGGTYEESENDDGVRTVIDDFKVILT
uniref:Uncharacterized protein n=1 Tax=Setaria digitata TaxID=48799 RepID=A0A915PR99_9BILA